MQVPVSRQVFDFAIHLVGIHQAQSAIANVMSSVVLFVVLMVISYIAISMTVHKAPLFSGLSRSGKDAVVKLSSVVVFGLLGYYISRV